MAQLAVTVTDGENTQYYEFSEETSLEDLKCIVLADFGKSGDDVHTIELIKDKRPLQGPSNTSLKALGVNKGDLLFYSRKKYVSSTAASTSSMAQPPALDPAMQAKMAELVKSIKIPKNLPKAKPKDVFEGAMFQDEARRIFSKMALPNVQAHFRELCPAIIEQYTKEPNNFEGFARVFQEFLKKEWRKKELMADPTSEEGQRLLAEQIRLSNIDHSYEMAMEHNPEAYVSVHMLYVNMNINGFPVKAFVDSGAQVSVMSLACAKRCDLEHLIDRRFQGTVRGVGGQQNFVGKIHMCKVQIEDHFFPCYFDVLADRDMDVLFGLNILRRHQCSIDLGQNKLIFGDGTSTPFLGEAEVEAYKLATGISNQEMVSIGIDEAVAERLLRETLNDLPTAVQRALDKSSGNTMEE
ncbi:unnamed protein product, partial [Mesorhabditis belari]|uniref:Aspartic peptidase DDI1-type domain-containing protein n=1 Tax=Mesorhabditis belari TaxID=2138241 RepID=A0AAF3J954_9BILA